MFRRANGFVSALLLAPIVTYTGCGSAPDNADTPVVAERPSPRANQAPAIDRPADGFASIGQAYTQQLVALDADGDELRFTAENLPPWARIDASTGSITGTPGERDAGVYEGIVVTVADASRSTRSSPFLITVSDPPTGTAALQWDTPSLKVNGSPLDDLAGYRIRYGRNSEDLDQSVFIGDPAVTSYEFTSLAPGIWYFAVIAVNASGLEGPPTITTMKSI